MSRKPIRIIDLDSLHATVDRTLAFDAVRHALTLIADNGVEVPKELAFKLHNQGEMHIKGARLRSEPWVTFKLASGSFPRGTNSGCSILLDADTGEPSVILDDGGWLTEMRTAAAGALATDLLAISGPLSVAILGTGVQARYQLAALRERRELSAVRVWGRSPSRTRDFANETASTPCASVEEAVTGADAVVTTTSATSPILSGMHVGPGMHITAMGADMTGKRELASDVLDQATVIAGDDLSTCAHVGELQYSPAHAGRATELALLLAAQDAGSPARPSADDITIADMCGNGAFDAAIAAAAVNALGI